MPASVACCPALLSPSSLPPWVVIVPGLENQGIGQEWRVHPQPNLRHKDSGVPKYCFAGVLEGELGGAQRQGQGVMLTQTPSTFRRSSWRRTHLTWALDEGRGFRRWRFRRLGRSSAGGAGMWTEMQPGVGCPAGYSEGSRREKWERRTGDARPRG